MDIDFTVKRQTVDPLLNVSNASATKAKTQAFDRMGDLKPRKARVGHFLAAGFAGVTQETLCGSLISMSMHYAYQVR